MIPRITACILVAILACAASAQVSLWSTGASGAPAADLLREVKARDFKVNDIVTVVVVVSAEASTDEDAETEKKNTKTELAINQYLKLQREGLQFNLKGEKPEDLKLDLTGHKKFEGQGEADRSDTLRTHIAATITDIKPNGNLVIEAKQVLSKQRERTTITLSGVVRPQDVNPDNTLYSYNIADADIRYESNGPVTDANRRGWLAKILDKVWPF